MKKSISFILVMLMVLCMIPGVAMAEEYVAMIGTQGYPSIKAAVDAAQDGDTIVVTKNHVIDCSTPVAFHDNDAYAIINVVGETVTIDLNGKQVTGTDNFDSGVVIIFASSDKGHLILKDSVGGGSIEITKSESHKERKPNVYALLGSYDGEDEYKSYLTVEGGSYKLDKAHDSLIYSAGNRTTTVNGGNFHLGNVNSGTNGKPWIFNAYGANERKVVVEGGTFNFDINHQYWCFEVEVAKEKAVKNNDDGTWTVVDAAAYVNELVDSYTHPVGYTSLEEAVSKVSAKGSGTEDVGLVTDCPIDKTLMVNESFELIPNGKTIIWEGNDTDPMFTVAADKTLTLPDNFIPKRYGYNFEGWYQDEDRTKPYPDAAPAPSPTVAPTVSSRATRSTSGISIYAKWSVDESNPSASPEITPAPKSSGSGISVKYNGGNSFSTSNPSVPTGVEIDGVPVTFNGTGSNFSVGCISSDAKWVTVRWNSTSVTTNFTPDGLVECSVSIPKTGDMSFWAAIAEFFGF